MIPLVGPSAAPWRRAPVRRTDARSAPTGAI